MAADLPDPTRPPQVAVASPAGEESSMVPWKLSMIKVTNGKYLALINGQIVSQGDRIGGAVVKRIGATGVAITEADEDMVLSLGSHDFKVPSK